MHVLYVCIQGVGDRGTEYILVTLTYLLSKSRDRIEHFSKNKATLYPIFSGLDIRGLEEPQEKYSQDKGNF